MSEVRDVLPSARNDRIDHYSSDGNLLERSDTRPAGFNIAPPFDDNGKVLVANFAAPASSESSPTGTLVGTGYKRDAKSAAENPKHVFYEPSTEILFFGCLAALTVIKLGSRVWRRQQNEKSNDATQTGESG